MIARYSALDRDARGEEKRAIENDGWLVKCGVEFTGIMVADFGCSISNGDLAPTSFIFHYDLLCSYMIECDMSLTVAAGNESLHGLLHLRLELRGPQ